MGANVPRGSRLGGELLRVALTLFRGASERLHGHARPGRSPSLLDSRGIAAYFYGCACEPLGASSRQGQKGALMHHSHTHMLLCVSFGVLAAVLSALGAGFWALIPAAGCAVTCAQMIVMMVRGGHHQPHG